VTQQPRQPGTDLISDLQRWLVRSGARGMSRELGGQFRSAFGRGGGSGDVWESATAVHHEAPECAWCPVCRAARRLNQSGPGLASHVAAATEALGTVVQDALSVFESAMAASRSRARDEADSAAAGRGAWHAADSPATGSGVWAEAASAGEPGGSPREPDDRR
jgi:hypothetical protein